MRPPGAVAEEMYQSLLKEWVSHVIPYRVNLTGTLPSGLTVTVAGYQDYTVVSCGGKALIPLPTETAQLDSIDETYNPTGFTVVDEVMTFFGFDSGDSYDITYFSDYSDLALTSEPAATGMTHMALANELAWRFWRFGNVPLTPGDLLERQKNERMFKREASGRTTDLHKPLQPDPMWVKRYTRRVRT